MNASTENHRPAPRTEDLVLALLCTAAGPLLWWFGTSGPAGTPVGGGLHLVEQVVASLCAGAGAVIAMWWVMALVGTVVLAVGHRWRSVRLTRIGRGLSPVFLRRVAVSVLGVNLLVAPGAWAHTGFPDPSVTAVHTSTPASAAREVPESGLPHPGWLPSSSSAEPAPGPSAVPTPTWKPSVPAPAAPGAPRTARSVADSTKTATVRRGDCLWDIAAHELGPAATALEIDRRWREWHDHNRSTIGRDADLLVPGTVLVAPPLD